MILLIYQVLTSSLGLKIPSAFTYSSTRMMLAALTSLLFIIFFGPRFIRKLYEMKTGQSIRVEDCPLLVELHAKKKDTPTMGGILDPDFDALIASDLDGLEKQFYPDLADDDHLSGRLRGIRRLSQAQI